MMNQTSPMDRIEPITTEKFTASRTQCSIITIKLMLPSPYNWGWQQLNNSWSPFWTALPLGKESGRELIRCGCRASCRGRFKCLKANLACTGLCNCGGNCQQPQICTTVSLKTSVDRVRIRQYINRLLNFGQIGEQFRISPKAPLKEVQLRKLPQESQIC